MDLSTLRKKLDQGRFGTVQSFRSDACLIFSNAFKFNTITSTVFQDAITLFTVFDEKFTEAFPDFQVKDRIQGKDREKIDGLLRYLESLLAIKEFMYKVNPTIVPGYYSVISSPIDFGVIKARFYCCEYSTIDQVYADFQLMFKNCYKYNPSPIVKIHQQCKELEAAFEVRWNQPDELPFLDTDEGKRCKQLLDLIVEHEASFAFRLPVDAVALGIPQYHEIIKQPMDFSTIATKMPTYTSVKEFTDDVELVLANCFTFNPPGFWILIPRSSRIPSRKDS